MEQNIISRKPFLFPRSFKKIGILLTAASIATLIIIKETGIIVEPSQIALFKMVAHSGVFLGLFFIGWSRDKMEDEMTISLRLKSASSAFVFGILYSIISPIVDITFREPIQVLSGSSLLISMLLIHIMTYYILKSNR